MAAVMKIKTAEIGTQSEDRIVEASSIYTQKFFGTRQVQTRKAASYIVPGVLEIVKPGSVIDVGCGTGDFLAAFQEHGIEDILGIDGNYVQRNLLAIPREAFVSFDLARPFVLDRIYDLAVCLEVAEHLHPANANDFIASLTCLAPIILFSAAIPYQGGNGHLNEQWPEYWANLFKQHGFVPVDALRQHIWHNREIPFWYRQNILFFCKEEVLAGNERLAVASRATSPDALSLVHPDIYLECNTKYLRMLRHMLTHTTSLWRIKQKVSRLVGWKGSSKRNI